MGSVIAKASGGVFGFRQPPAARIRPGSRLEKPQQNWVLDPLQDSLFILAAPLIVLVLAVAAFLALSPSQATALILGIHIVFTVAHHMPTFMRIYADVELLRRFRWTLLLAPVIPMSFSLGVLGFINYKGYPVEYFLYMYLMLALWDPWHFLRQHYGFMRIYDRHNAAPRRAAARMDLMLCVSAFIFIMLASGSWVPEILADLFNSAQLPFLMAVSAQTLAVMIKLSGLAAALAATVYGVYLYWCWRHRYFVSPAKLALAASTFGVMYLAYTPNSWILSLAPGWSFKVGFACVGIVHMTQYLAIVWRYNRNLAARAGRARAGWLRTLHVRGGWLAGAGYVAFCLLYGDLITTKFDSRWLMSVLLAVGFTSTLTHYYFDGFIWKVRHRQNSENLESMRSTGGEGEGAACPDEGSWWNGARIRPAPEVLLRQLLYFGIPMAVLTSGAVSVWSHQHGNYIEHMYRAQTLEVQGHDPEARDEARLAFIAMQNQLPYARRLAQLQPTSAHDAELAFLIYNHARYAHDVMPALDGRVVGLNEASLYLAGVEEAIGFLQRAASRGGPLAHTGRPGMSDSDAARVVESWQQAAARLEVTASPDAPDK